MAWSKSLFESWRAIMAASALQLVNSTSWIKIAKWRMHIRSNKNMVTQSKLTHFVNFLWKFRVIPFTVTYHLSYAKLLSSRLMNWKKKLICKC